MHLFQFEFIYVQSEDLESDFTSIMTVQTSNKTKLLTQFRHTHSILHVRLAWTNVDSST